MKLSLNSSFESIYNELLHIFHLTSQYQNKLLLHEVAKWQRECTSKIIERIHWCQFTVLAEVSGSLARVADDVDQEDNH